MLNKTNLARIDLNLLVLFETVFEERHVARAAMRLHVSPSAVSHGLGRLRRLMDDPLFLRQPKGVVPTERAKLLAAQMDVSAMNRFIHADSLAFVSIDGLYRAIGEEERDGASPQTCDACFTGDYPTSLTDREDLERRNQLLLQEGRRA